MQLTLAVSVYIPGVFPRAAADVGRLADALELELAAMGAPAGALVEAARLVARRLDATPSDREVPALTRELRRLLAELRSLSGTGAGEVEAFLSSVAVSDFGGR